MEVQCNPALIAEMSLSFQDELTSTLQNALGVAVEIAVVEITKLLDRALTDVQEKVQEALRDNNALRFRLQTAESQLSTMRARMDQQPSGFDDFPIASTSQTVKNSLVSCRGQRGRRQVKPRNVVRSSPIHETDITVGSEHNNEACGSKETNANLLGTESLDETTHGVMGVQALTSEESTQNALQETNDLNNDQHKSKNDQQCAGTDDESAFEVVVKEEKEEDYDDPIPVSLSGDDEPNSDSFSLAQSRLLEDWRPLPFHSDEHHQIDQHGQSTSFSLDQDFFSSSTSSQHVLFPDLHRNNERRPYGSGRTPHHCGLCGRGFNRKQHLKIHQRIHTGERPYACSVCSARFRHALTLTRHFRLHTGEKPYACEHCGKTFRNGGGLRFHQCTAAPTV